MGFREPPSHGCAASRSDWALLWRTASGHGYEPGDAKEAAALRRWKARGGCIEGEDQGGPWARSSWEIDTSPWAEAVAALRD